VFGCQDPLAKPNDARRRASKARFSRLTANIQPVFDLLIASNPVSNLKNAEYNDSANS
jgi:hypothetical protein